MTHYLEFSLKGNKNQPTPALMSALLNVMHHTFVRLNTTKLGVSFPCYGTTLGDSVRLHGEPHLLKLFVLNVDALPIGVKVSDIQELPEQVQWVCFGRVRPSKQNSKLQAGLKSGHIKDAKAYVRKMCEEVLSEPFFFSQSTSTKQGYKRFVSKTAVESETVGDFDSFGMSKVATVPLFQ